MRGIYTPVTNIRRQVFKKVAELAYGYENDYSKVDEIPFEIIKGEVASYRESVFKERAIVAERIRLACGLSVRRADEHAPLSRDFAKAIATERVFEAPLVNVIPFACNACDETAYVVTDNCRNCMAHPCTSVCPVKAVSIVNGKSHIDKEKCVKCGRCAEYCPYDALKKGENVIAEIAPAFVGQFGPLATPNKVNAALLKLGFKEVYEVALGADTVSIEEAEDFVKKVPTELPFLATSCCPSWSIMAKTLFPEIANCVSDTITPMVATARTIKKKHEDAKVVFIGPCASKKLEAFRKTVKSDVDFVITFEELMGMFAAKEIDFSEEFTGSVEEAALTGRGFAVAGGVADAVVSIIKRTNPDMQVNVDRAEGLANCKKMLTLAKAGKRNGYLLEGMACEGGCIGGAGTLQPLKKAAAQVKMFAEQSPYKNALDKEE